MLKAPQPSARAPDSGERLCEQQPALCQAAQESATLARVFGDMAMERARVAIRESEAFQEFAGSELAADGGAETP